LKIVIQKQTSSPESSFIEKTLEDAVVFNQYEKLAHCEYYDVAVCLGPVRQRPRAKKSILFVFGETMLHHDLEWDLVVVTCRKAFKNAMRVFGHKCKVVIAAPALADLHMGQRRIVGQNRFGLYAGARIFKDVVYQMNLWDNSNHIDLQTFNIKSRVPGMECALNIEIYNSLEFNSLVRGGAVGIYPSCMDDGYDIQVRRHLALGGAVACPKDAEVIGELVDVVYDINDVIHFEKVERREGRLEEVASISLYSDLIKEIVGL